MSDIKTLFFSDPSGLSAARAVYQEITSGTTAVLVRRENEATPALKVMWDEDEGTLGVTCETIGRIRSMEKHAIKDNVQLREQLLFLFGGFDLWLKW